MTRYHTERVQRIEKQVEALGRRLAELTKEAKTEKAETPTELKRELHPVRMRLTVKQRFVYMAGNGKGKKAHLISQDDSYSYPVLNEDGTQRIEYVIWVACGSHWDTATTKTKRVFTNDPTEICPRCLKRMSGEKKFVRKRRY